MSGCDVSSYHGDSRHMLITLTRGDTHTYTYTLEASRTGNCQEKSESTFSLFSEISAARSLSEGLSKVISAEN